MLYALMSLAAATAPTGTYHGVKSFLGETIDATIKIDSTSALDLTISGAASISCTNEGYSCTVMRTRTLAFSRALNDKCV